MENTSRQTIEQIIRSQRQYFASGITRPLAFRIDQLQKFRKAILLNEDHIAKALWSDLHKSHQEAYLTEISIVIQEIDYHLNHLKSWMKPAKVTTPFHLLPSQYRIYSEPLGSALVIAPWNYPFQLLMNPVVGALSSGCTALLKPSPYTPATAQIMEKLIHETFARGYMDVVQGDRTVNQILLEQPFDLIFFTGSPAMGKVVMKAASEHLTPVVLELGGKSPCIVDADANLDIAAQRIAWGKLINAGQTCIAPDYLFVHESVKEVLIDKIILAIEHMYGKDPAVSPWFPRIVNQQAMERLEKLILHGNIRYGGIIDADQKYISPTIIDALSTADPIMQEEIFGPILPVFTFHDPEEPVQYILAHEKPLAFYYFGKRSHAESILLKTTSGGGCINDVLIHIANHQVPFGGVGNSGMNKYHGKNSFLAFSNQRAIASSPTWIDIPFRYPPFKNFKTVRKFV